MMNPVAALKYTRWNDRRSKSLIKEIKSMYNEGGIQQFRKGMFATMMRDVIFGSVFATMRHHQRDKHKLHPQDYDKEKEKDTTENWFEKNRRVWIDMNSAFVATMLSSPYNYIRNMQYAVPRDHDGRLPTSLTIFKNFFFEGLKQQGRLAPVRYWIFQLRIGWGTARVAVGMALTSLCWEVTTQLFHIDDSQ
ncbi:hypothetical protein RFI_40416 [Reticulomyxa filosa]|uniref:Uncharacterized protein n=1 Tax=Reticulomyxa filosa TaxID=46433 RepID=X6L754_RETFI|nr:hypothetical protein RFI_40416 [Reticulomyxa filosa]|eukprot:ETN97115.1 hypothetical protein RFI_40416 [Reticulomyxa filosa]